jgi:hypothetical protein
MRPIGIAGLQLQLGKGDNSDRIAAEVAAVKARLQAASYRQAQVVDCSHFVVLAVRRDLDAAHVDRHIARMAEVRGIILSKCHYCAICSRRWM